LQFFLAELFSPVPAFVEQQQFFAEQKPPVFVQFPEHQKKWVPEYRQAAKNQLFFF